MNPIVQKKSGRRSMALVVTLVLVTLLSALIVAFTMRARLDLAATASYAAVPQADGIARGGVEFLVGWLRREIEAGSKSYGVGGGTAGPGEPAAYAPLDEANLMIRRSVKRAGGGSFQSLAKVSKSGQDFFQAGDGWQFDGSGGMDLVADVTTVESSANGRRMAASRWAAPGLLTRDEVEDDFDDAQPNEDVLPDWIYVTREGPNKVSEVDQQQREEDPENSDFVLGRFAYAVYDVSGLLDITVAGYPGSLDDHYGDGGVAAKGSLAWADPSAMDIPNSDGVDREKLVEWRNAASKSDYVRYVTNAAKSGFMSRVAGDNAFFSRSDLVGMAKAIGAGQFKSQVLDTNALPFLTVFSREMNAPSWYPKNPRSSLDCNIDYEKKAFDEDSRNRWTAGVLVESDFTSPDGVQFKRGEPLLKRRFALSRFDLLTRAASGDQEKIRYFFGLVNAGVSSGSVKRWVYRPVGSSVADPGSIKTLDDIAKEEREPNFFELIAAGVLHGSLAKTGQMKNISGNLEERGLDYRLARDASSYHQILQIGANIIDQYDTDDVPTTISSVARMTGLANYNNDLINSRAATIFGVENLPYISMMFSSVVRDMSKRSPRTEWETTYAYTPTGVDDPWNSKSMFWNRNPEPNSHPWVTMFLHFQLWNPHRNARDAEPGQYRVAAEIGQTYLRPPRGLNGNEEGEASDPFPGEWATANFDSYRYQHGEIVELGYFRQTMYPRFGRNFQSSPTSIEFSTTAASQMFEQPKLLRLGDNTCPITVRNPLDIFTVQGASMTGIRLGDTLVVCNLDMNNTNRYDFTRWTDTNNDGARELHTYGPTVWFNGLYPLVIELQKLIDGNWVTYKYIVPRRDGNQLNGLPRNDDHNTCWHYNATLDAVYSRRWPILQRYCPVSDPRCTRFGFGSGGGIDTNPNASRREQNWAKVGDRTLRYYPAYYSALYGGTINRSSERLDPDSGFWYTPWESGPYKPLLRRASDGYTEQNAEGNSVERNDDLLFYLDADSNIRSLVAPAELAENSYNQARMDGTSVMWARDPDNVVRRGDGWRQRNVSPFHMGAATGNQVVNASELVGRPIFLNRPFHSVAELGYVLRDDPWKTLNFFWGDSADAGLLDMFCLYEGEQFRPVVAGVVNPNTAPKEVLTAVLSGAALRALVSDKSTPRLSDTSAGQIAEAIKKYIGNIDNPQNVLQNKADFVAMCEELCESEGVKAVIGGDASEDHLEDTDTARESLVRALADVCNTRTWNLFLDVVGQSGRFTQASRSPRDFVVTGERRLWIHLALDRYTGEVVDMDIEPVFE